MTTFQRMEIYQRQELESALGECNSDVCLSARNPQGDVHDERDRVREYVFAEGDEESPDLPDR